jgi:hypothetical protein
MHDGYCVDTEEQGWRELDAVTAARAAGTICFAWRVMAMAKSRIRSLGSPYPVVA